MSKYKNINKWSELVWELENKTSESRIFAQVLNNLFIPSFNEYFWISSKLLGYISEQNCPCLQRV